MRSKGGLHLLSLADGQRETKSRHVVCVLLADLSRALVIDVALWPAVSTVRWDERRRVNFNLPSPLNSSSLPTAQLHHFAIATMVAPTLRLAASSLVRQRMPVMAATAAAPRLAAPSMLRTAAPRAVAPTSFAVARRGYASSSGLSQQEIQNRIVEILKSFEKVDPAKVNAEASFTSTLGLDSLDAVEVVMAIEEE